MAGRNVGNNQPLRAAADDGDGVNGGPARRLDSELRRMAAFRVHETANRIATLANSAQNEALRRELLAICQRLMHEERLLLDQAD